MHSTFPPGWRTDSQGASTHACARHSHLDGGRLPEGGLGLASASEEDGQEVNQHLDGGRIPKRGQGGLGLASVSEEDGQEVNQHLDGGRIPEVRPPMHALNTPTRMEDSFPRRAEGFAMDWAAIKVSNLLHPSHDIARPSHPSNGTLQRIQSLQHLEQKVKSRFGYTRATWRVRNAGFGSKAISIAGLTGANCRF
ncbi:hypothetical protein B0F90DRAFT_1818636 [Multifurca ochricompacta]|uniref:Uncharacterized protein n=1 Tax=Multifurca ochricompacta TaxID=376703 RepID=A0AAD4M1L8_9AGAM|nr:hypothetical protein B0F90DRAFT_1818636 [Multifurca ochricompacta]